MVHEVTCQISLVLLIACISFGFYCVSNILVVAMAAHVIVPCSCVCSCVVGANFVEVPVISKDCQNMTPYRPLFISIHILQNVSPEI